MPFASTARFTASTCSNHPVVPITMLTPSAAIPSTLRRTAAGMEKSMATPIERKFSAVSPSKLALLNSSSLSATVKPYSGASCSMSRPILPYPTIARRRGSGMHGLAALEYGGIHFGEKLLVQGRHGALQVGLGHH